MTIQSIYLIQVSEKADNSERKPRTFLNKNRSKVLTSHGSRKRKNSRTKKDTKSEKTNHPYLLEKGLPKRRKNLGRDAKRTLENKNIAIVEKRG